VLVKLAGDLPELAAQVDIGRVGLHCVSSESHALYKLEGVALHNLAVLEGARLGFVSVGHHEMRQAFYQ